MIRTFSLPLAFGLLGASGCQPGEAPRGAALVEPAVASTETSRDFDDYVLHFNAQTTDRLSAEVAREHGIARSANRAMLTVSVLRKEAGTMGVPVEADVRASAVNLSGQMKPLTVRDVREENAIYYVADTTITDAETLIFTIGVVPENETETLSVRFMKQFFID